MGRNWEERVDDAASFLSLKELMLHNYLALMRLGGRLPFESHAYKINGSYERPTSYAEFARTFERYEVRLKGLRQEKAISEEEFSEGINLLLEMRQVLLQRNAQQDATGM